MNGAALDTDGRRVKQLRMLTDVSRALTNAVSLDEVLRLAVDRSAEVLDSEKVVLMLINDEGLLSVRAAHGIGRDVTEHFKEALDETVLHRLEGLLDASPGNFLGVPLIVGGEVAGILAATLTGSISRTDEHEWLLSALADQAAVALEKTRLDQAAEFRERLIGIVSHDLRNPLNTIMLGTGVLEREVLSVRGKSTLKRIRSSTERASRMVRDLLDYTQAHLGGEIPIEKKRAELGTIVREVVDEMNAIGKDRVALHLDGDTHGKWDVDRMMQVVGNLVSNALQYSAPATMVRVDVVGKVDVVVVSVHNHGEAIRADHLAHIFEPLHRAGSSLDLSLRSVGLGLYIVRHLVKSHGGTVTVSSSDEQGTTFTVSLPR